MSSHAERPNILLIMTDQQRADTIRRAGSDAAAGFGQLHTPNIDRLVRRGVNFTKAYTSCPVCVAARYTIRTGREPLTTRCFSNGRSKLQDIVAAGQAEHMETRCGLYLARTLSQLGYRTFGVGKFHTSPRDEDVGYDVQYHSEELYQGEGARQADSYASWLAHKHPEFAHVEQLQGERTEMYYMPQTSPLPAHATVEAWVAARTVEQISHQSSKPYYGFVSFIGPHPPCAPPVPFNRMYNPDRMASPRRGSEEIDGADEQIAWMNHAIWADDLSDATIRAVRSRYYGELSYIDACLGKILDMVEAGPDGGANTLIVFTADHGDGLGDHRMFQKENYFEEACRIPFLVSWPAHAVLGQMSGVVENRLVGQADLFGLVTAAAGSEELRDGVSILSMLSRGPDLNDDGSGAGRQYFFGVYSEPGSQQFKIMVRSHTYKYIFMANGGRELLFNLVQDPFETTTLCALSAEENSDKLTAGGETKALRLLSTLRSAGAAFLQASQAGSLALDPASPSGFLEHDFVARPHHRIMQMAADLGVTGFPDQPGDVLERWPPRL